MKKALLRVVRLILLGQSSVQVAIHAQITTGRLSLLAGLAGAVVENGVQQLCPHGVCNISLN
jgi:hypothetical protein